MSALANPAAVGAASDSLGLAGSSLLVGTVRRSAAHELVERIKGARDKQDALTSAGRFWTATDEAAYTAAVEEFVEGKHQLRLLVADALGISVDDAMVAL